MAKRKTGKKSKAKQIHRHPAYRMVPGILNFFIWGLGYLVDKRTSLGILWIAAFIAVRTAVAVSGYAWYLTTTPGNLFVISHLVISTVLLIDGIGGRGSKRF